MALGITWLLDGLEVTLAGAMGGVLQNPRTLGLSPGDVGITASFYIAGAVIGALGFGRLADRYGRQKIFYTTLICYLTGVVLSALSWNFASFASFRLLTGLGIGGEYAAVNSAIDEFMPARLRGRLSLIINGTYWLGAAAGAGATVVLLNPHVFPLDIGWRCCFGIGAIAGSATLLLRRFVPESPRWLVTHGETAAAEAVMREMERHAAPRSHPGVGDKTITIRPRKYFGVLLVLQVMFGQYRARAVLALVLMAAQAFMYNALFFTYALMLVKFYHVAPEDAGLYLLPLAAGNFIGPVLLGRFYDTIGRRVMIAGSYAVSAALLAGTGYLFALGLLSVVTQTLAWCAIFFAASAAASSAYLTASEIFPLETRALAIAIFYALGTAAGGIAAPALFGHLIGTGSRWAIFTGYVCAASLMLFAAGTAAWLGIDAENRALEDITPPLSNE